MSVSALPRAARRMQALPLHRYTLAHSDATRMITPALCVHLDKVRHNVRTMIHGHMGGRADKWRPHVKTIKTPELMQELVDAGVRKFKCATPRELEVLCGTLEAANVAAESDVLVAFAHVGANLRRVAELANKHASISTSILVEDIAGVDELPDGLGAFVDVNPQMDRTGIPLEVAEDGAVRAIAKRCGERGINFRGVHFYCGHSSRWEPEERLSHLAPLYDRLLAISKNLSDEGYQFDELITAGTPSVPYALQYDPLNSADHHATVSPGTVVLSDLMTMQLCPTLDLLPAAVVATHVVSHPGEGLFTVDVGSKGLAAEMPEYGVGMFVGHTPEYVPLRPSEEHLPARAEGCDVPARGEQLLVVPTHVCPTVNLAERMVLLDEDEKDGTPRVVGTAAVTGRAHEVSF